MVAGRTVDEHDGFATAMFEVFKSGAVNVHACHDVIGLATG
jgi:hypothetical protein